MYERRIKLQNVCLMIIDAVCLIASYLLASYIRLGVGEKSIYSDMHKVVASLWLVFLTYFCVFLFFNMNRYFLRRDRAEELVYVIKVNLFVAFVLVAAFFAAKQLEMLSRGIWILTVIFNTVFMYITHIAAKNILKSKIASGAKRYMLLVSTTDRVEKVLNQMKKSGSYKNYVIKAAIMDEDQKGKTYGDVTVVANCEDLYEYARVQIMDEVYINASGCEGEKLEKLIETFESMGITVHLNINVLEDQEGFLKQINMVGDYPVVSFAPSFPDENKLFLKRIIDIVGALVGLTITAVITIFVAPAIKLESKGPLFFKQRRVGKNGRYFYIYKFRSMCQDAEAKKKALMSQNEMKGAMFKMTDDPRVTKVGKFIRATSIDELPQFWNILKGDMSLVGTRPPTVDEFKEYEAPHKRRLSMEPGLTGMWQVSGRSNIEDFEEVVKLDCYYIDNWSLQLDAKILLKTVAVVFKKVGSR